MVPAAWERPYTPDFRGGDNTKQEIYIAVGAALTAWEELEAEVANLFAHLTGSADQYHLGPAIRAFGGVSGAKMRAQMLDLASSAFFDNLIMLDDQYELITTTFKDVTEAIKSYRGWSDRRNDVAHGAVREADDADPESEMHTGPHTYLLYPSESNTRKWPTLGEPAYNFNAREIFKFTDGFIELRQHVIATCEMIADLNAKLSK
ncbi:hypothetical protein [Bradyrhizobium sp. USDA 3315]